MDYILLHMAENGRGIIIPTSSIEKVLELSDGTTMIEFINDKGNIRVKEEIDFIYKKLEPMYLDDWSYPDIKSTLNYYKKKEENDGNFE